MVLEWLKRHAWKAVILLKGIPCTLLGHSATEVLKISELYTSFQVFLYAYL